MYKLPDKLRPTLARPFGPVLSTEDALTATAGKIILAVGDVVTAMFVNRGHAPRVMVVDGMTQRGQDVEPFMDALPAGVRRVEVESPAAVISRALWDAVTTAAQRPESTLITVTGEEDLAALPALAAAPLGAAVCYGQPGKGVVVVEVTPAVQERVRDILSQMEE